jgi:hypothetical protein
MATCSNCGKGLSCGCQKRTASDGKSVCSNCLSKYEATLKPKPQPKPTSTTPELNVWGKDRYKHLQKFIK